MRITNQLLGGIFIGAIASTAAAQDAGVVAQSEAPAPLVIAALSLNPDGEPAGPEVTEGTPAFAFGQIRKPTPAPPTPDHTGVKAMAREFWTDMKHLPSKENVFWAGIGGGLALATHPVDSTANAHLSGPFLDSFFKPGAIIGEGYTLFPIAATVYVIGRAKDDKRMSHMGSDLVQSLVMAELLTVSLKYTVQRERPDGSGANSFPSGHAAGTMAFATALERHFNWHYFLPAYAVASYVAMSRLHDNVHFVSDVVFGSAVGIIAGRTVTRTGHAFPVAASAVPGGFAVVYHREAN